MKETNRRQMRRVVAVFVGLLGAGALAHPRTSDHSAPHMMQHGFVLSADDSFASHLVATGHHSRQAEITGQLTIVDSSERAIYEKQKAINGGNSYFLLQAQGLDLPSLKAGQTLEGHIVESKLGEYEPKNVIVQKATFRVEQVLLNIENPFFGDE